MRRKIIILALLLLGFFSADRPRLELFDKSMECDRSHPRTDVCVVRGDVRVIGRGGARAKRKLLPRTKNYTVLQVIDLGRPSEAMANANANAYAYAYTDSREERVRPYTRKWEENVMKTIDEVRIKRQIIRTGTNTTEKEKEKETQAQAQAQTQTQTQRKKREREREREREVRVCVCVRARFSD